MNNNEIEKLEIENKKLRDKLSKTYKEWLIDCDKYKILDDKYKILDENYNKLRINYIKLNEKYNDLLEEKKY